MQYNASFRSYPFIPVNQWRMNGKGGLVDERPGLLCWGGWADGASGLEIGILIRDVTLHMYSTLI